MSSRNILGSSKQRQADYFETLKIHQGVVTVSDYTLNFALISDIFSGGKQ